MVRGGGKRQAENDASSAEVERISALPLEQLAAEVMTEGSGGAGPGVGGVFARPSDIAGPFIPGESTEHFARQTGSRRCADGTQQGARDPV